MILVAAAACALVLAAGSPAGTIFSTNVNFVITYNPDCTFSVAIDGGITMNSATGSGATIPPGPYQLTIHTPLPDNMWTTCSDANFSLSGPGVSYSAILGTDLGPYGASFPETFAPASTYTMVDASQPNDPVVFTTAATGSSSSLLPPPPPPVSSAPPVGTSQNDIVGSAVAPSVGALRATVAASGKATLLSGAKPVVSLTAGRYKITVSDDSSLRRFFVQKHGGTPQTTSGGSVKGTKTIELDLTAGTWTYYSTSAHETQFTVTG
jgi:hypothetical protein